MIFVGYGWRGEVGEEEEDVFEVELASVDDVSFALRFAVGFEALEFESIPGATTLNLREERLVVACRRGAVRWFSLCFEDKDSNPPHQKMPP